MNRPTNQDELLEQLTGIARKSDRLMIWMKRIAVQLLLIGVGVVVSSQHFAGLIPIVIGFGLWGSKELIFLKITEKRLLGVITSHEELGLYFLLKGEEPTLKRLPAIHPMMISRAIEERKRS